MATVNIGTENVLVIEIHDGEIYSVTDEGRSVYENSKGRFIKTKKQGYGQVWLDDADRAVIAYRRWRPIKVHPDNVQQALHRMFSNYGLNGFLK